MAPGIFYSINTPGDRNEFDPEAWKSKLTTHQTKGDDYETSSNPPVRHPETGIDVLIIGAGMGGLTTALECWRKGHNVVDILERSDGPVYSGDIILMQPSSITHLRHWPDLIRNMEADQVDARVEYIKHSGEHVYGPTVPQFNEPEYLEERKGAKIAPAQIRQKFYRMLLRQVAKLGLKIQYGKKVQKYFEDIPAGKGGVLLDGNEIRLADVVVAADGLKSSSELLITGKHVSTKSSGMSIYRTVFPRETAMKDPLVRKRWGDNPASWEYWLGPGMYVGIFISDEIAGFGFTVRDTHSTGIESWEPDTDAEDVVKALLKVPDWDPAIVAFMRTAPKGQIVHWPLLWRDLREQWTSKGGHVVQVGDAAHAFTPTSGNGATQALEDAVTLATCLQLGGCARNAALSAKIYNKLRYQRVSCAQKMTFVNAQLMTETNWDAIWADPVKIKTRFPKWVFRHDPEAYAYEKYSQAFANLVYGAPFENTNFPPGHKFVPWTMEEVYRDIEAGHNVETMLDGDWS